MQPKPIPTGDISAAQSSRKMLPEITEASQASKRRFPFNCPCTALFLRVKKSWQASRRAGTKKSGDLSLCLIALGALALAFAGHFGVF